MLGATSFRCSDPSTRKSADAEKPRDAYNADP